MLGDIPDTCATRAHAWTVTQHKGKDALRGHLCMLFDELLRKYDKFSKISVHVENAFCQLFGVESSETRDNPFCSKIYSFGMSMERFLPGFHLYIANIWSP